jgi:glycerophosphoryl diester phosphodiesterase
MGGLAALTAAVALLAACAVVEPPVSTRPALVIAHRGASGYLPEHTLAAKAMAHAMGADFIEQDVVLSRDGVPVVLHDIHLGSTTDVAAIYPDRRREDGRYYAIDFDLAELRRLTTRERVGADGGAVFPGRFPPSTPFGGIPTLAEEIALVEGLNRSTGHDAGVYIEMKNSAFHDQHGLDLPGAVVAVLRETGWDERADAVFLQSFEPAVLRRLHGELDTSLPLIQLIGENGWNEDGAVDYDYLRSDAGLDEIAAYADGIGPWMMQLYRGRDDDGRAELTDLAARAHARGLAVHPYTFRADQLPPGIDSFAELHRLFLVDLAVDGLFTDFPDRSRALVDALAEESGR